MNLLNRSVNGQINPVSQPFMIESSTSSGNGEAPGKLLTLILIHSPLTIFQFFIDGIDDDDDGSPHILP
uniref:Uncharacterized protein n=1 Tax=Anopheles albimanus TaxID=7167 RepID=A0A182FWV0_ANOAL